MQLPMALKTQYTIPTFQLVFVENILLHSAFQTDCDKSVLDRMPGFKHWTLIGWVGVEPTNMSSYVRLALTSCGCLLHMGTLAGVCLDQLWWSQGVFCDTIVMSWFFYMFLHIMFVGIVSEIEREKVTLHIRCGWRGVRTAKWAHKCTLVIFTFGSTYACGTCL